MKDQYRKNHLLPFLKKSIAVTLLICQLCTASGHQMPNTVVLLDISPGKVKAALQLPLSELELAFGHDVYTKQDQLIERLGPQLKEYLLAHIHVMETKDKPWLVVITDMKLEEAQQAASGPPFREITVHLTFIPYTSANTRKFILDYDVIMHHVINHAAFVSIRSDWETGKAGGQPMEAGVIHWDLKDNVIYPLTINLEKGGWWTGFKSMLDLGMQHIKEGTDHLLFLLVLLLPAMLLVDSKNWGRFGGTRYSIVRLLKIITAFTIGHSVTLLIAALALFTLPQQPVEILIAVSILVSAIHAIYPIFPGKEVYVAGGFGLIHGLAFAAVLTNLHLAPAPLAVSILGFNLGIEAMQLFVVIMIIPWLMLLSQTNWYKHIRIAAGILAGIAALAWLAERVSGNANSISTLLTNIPAYAVRGIAVLAIFSLANLALSRLLWAKSTVGNTAENKD